PTEYVVGAWTPETLQSIVDALAPDVVVSCGWPNLTWLERANVPVALDLAGPHLLERAYQQYRDVETNAEEKLAALRRADFYTCISTRQKYYFIGWLAQAGVKVEDIPASLAVIPYSVDPVQPQHHRREGKEVKFVYGGIFLPWQNAAPALLAVAAALEEAGTGTLEVIGGKHPFHAVDTGNFGPLVDKLSTMPRVKMSGLLPHDELVERYTNADVAVDVMLPNAERDLAFPSRTIHYFWCGLPVIHAEFSEVASFIRKYDAGWVIPHDDAGILRDLVISILANPDKARLYSQHAQLLAHECFSWDKTIDELDNFVRNPYIRAERSQQLPEDKAVINHPEAGGIEASGIFVIESERELPPKAKRLHARRRDPQKQAASRSISLLRDLLPLALRRDRTSLVTGRKCIALSELTEGHSHGQRFLSPRSGMTSVRVEIGTFGRRNTSRLVLHLRAHPAAITDLYTLEVPVHNIRDGQPLLFRFPPIADSWNKWFYLVAECPDGVPGDAVTLLASTRPGPIKGQRYEDGLPANGSLLIDLGFVGDDA
ncbi:MAG: glycosyltransferase, partial [Chloroflexia bacterium]